MKLTREDIGMFEALRKSEVGKQLAEYIERLEGEICDVRNWTKDDSPESARQASKFLKELRAKLANPQKGQAPNTSEFI